MMRPFRVGWTYLKVRRSDTMSVNGITQTQAISAYNYQPETKTNTAAAENTASAKTAEETGVVYEPSNEQKVDSVKKTYKPDTALLNKLKADADAQTQQLRSLVEKLMLGQSDTYNKANDIWSFLREGNFTVDPATKAQAQADIAEDGYWGVEQTSDRIISFANALTGGDPDKIDDMREAFLKGYKQAEETWGGELPEISKKTYDAVLAKFDQLAADANGGTYTADSAVVEVAKN